MRIAFFSYVANFGAICDVESVYCYVDFSFFAKSVLLMCFGVGWVCTEMFLFIIGWFCLFV